MKRLNAPRIWGIATLMAAPTLSALAADNGVKLEPPVQPEKNRFGVSYRAGFNVTAKFKNVGNIYRGADPSGRDPGPATGGGVDRFYDDGYNRVDISGNKDGLTWFWAYKNDSQIVGDTVQMHSTSVAPITSKTFDNDPQHGFELTYNRELGRAENGKWSWGLEGGFGWTDIDIRDRRQLAGGVQVITDAFNLGGIDPSRNQIPEGGTAPDPYNVGPATFRPGTYEGPGALIEDSPTRSISSDPRGSVVNGLRAFDGDLFSFRVGPYVDLPLDERWTISLSAGFAVGVIDGEFRFDQTVTTPGGSTRQSGSGRNTDVLFGGFASASIHYKINQDWGAFVGGQYLGLADCYEAEARGQKIELDFARTAFFTAGLTYTF